MRALIATFSIINFLSEWVWMLCKKITLNMEFHDQEKIDVINTNSDIIIEKLVKTKLI